jgi:SUKH-4 immunity protein
MLRVTDDQCRAMEGLLPPETLAFLQGSGVPEVVVFRLIAHDFRLDLEPLLNGDVFRIGQVDGGWYAMGVQRTTGHFGYAFASPEQPPWCLVNSSVECFLRCFAASQRLWELEAAGQIEWDASGEFLEREIRRIDPVVFADENNIWSFLVEELNNGVV